MIHIVTKELAGLAGRVESEFFRIERENRWAASLLNGVIAGSAVAAVAWLVQTQDDRNLLLFACLGSSAASVVLSPVAKSNSLRSIVLAYLAASLVCVVLSPLHHLKTVPLALECFLAVSLSIFLMRMIDALHPAAAGSAMAFIIYDRDLRSLVLLIMAIIGLLTIVKVLVYIYREELTFRDFPCEFRRRYYGDEMTLTLRSDGPTDSAAQQVREGE